MESGSRVLAAVLCCWLFSLVLCMACIGCNDYASQVLVIFLFKVFRVVLGVVMFECDGVFILAYCHLPKNKAEILKTLMLRVYWFLSFFKCQS